MAETIETTYEPTATATAARLRAAESKHARLADERRTLMALAPGASEGERLRARARLAVIDSEVLEALAALHDARREDDDARAATRAAELARIDTHRRALTARLHATLETATQINTELSALDQQAESCGGTPASYFGVAEGGVMRAWERHVREHGLLD